MDTSRRAVLGCCPDVSTKTSAVTGKRIAAPTDPTRMTARQHCCYMEALTEYAYLARLREYVTSPAGVSSWNSIRVLSKMGKMMRINSNGLANVHQMNIPNVWGLMKNALGYPMNSALPHLLPYLNLIQKFVLQN
ncbi:hypothetical protein DAPPUDRAFT_253937 [Daphnia pulex]|uniref:Uncharacterized protein n=1 Tax=Daphnia pulex TaxID=6669 RepID=E9H5Z4_DAPPU|nr:hypothetical protein DAPPUDRAFT_253937 [Daphnia pulex]|eukprot:EFX72846.1 hypothetical protein DAPPUDRAFT_253937 [Daphnia pulex]